MWKRIRIILAVLSLCVLGCIGGYLIYRASSWHAVFLFSEKDLEWMEPYRDGDTVLFTSDAGTDTMLVAQHLYTIPELLGIHCFSNFYASGTYVNTICQKERHIICRFIISKVSDNYVKMVNNFNRRYSDDNVRLCDTSKVVVKGYMYKDAILMNDDNSSISQESENNCEYFIWSKSKGLLQYKYLNGDVYTFYKKIPRKK